MVPARPLPTQREEHLSAVVPALCLPISQRSMVSQKTPSRTNSASVRVSRPALAKRSNSAVRHRSTNSAEARSIDKVSDADTTGG